MVEKKNSLKTLVLLFLVQLILSCSGLTYRETIEMEDYTNSYYNVSHFPTLKEKRLKNDSLFHISYSLILLNKDKSNKSYISRVDIFSALDKAFKKHNRFSVVFDTLNLDSKPHFLKFPPEVAAGVINYKKIYGESDKPMLFPSIIQKTQFVKANRHRKAYYENYFTIRFNLVQYNKDIYTKTHALIIQMSQEEFFKNPEKLNITQDQWDFMVWDIMKDYIESLDK